MSILAEWIFHLGDMTVVARVCLDPKIIFDRPHYFDITASLFLRLQGPLEKFDHPLELKSPVKTCMTNGITQDQPS